MRRDRFACLLVASGLTALLATTDTSSARRLDETAEPRLEARDRLVLLVFGDSGTGGAGQRRVGQAMFEICRARNCDLALLLGDAIYDDGIRVRGEAASAGILEQFRIRFEEPYASFRELNGVRFWVALGNHDYRRGALSTLIDYSSFSDLWRLPAFHYEVPGLPRWLQLQAVFTDTDVRGDLNGLQIERLKRALCDDRPERRWSIAFGHQPVFNSGHHRGDANERRARALLAPVFRECGVQLYLAGHAHHQEHLTAPGFEQIIQGAAAKIDGPSRPRPQTLVRQRHYAKAFGFAIVDVDPSRLRLDFYDVVNTRESGAFVAPRPNDIVLRYSWCATPNDVGRPDEVAQACDR